ncbi:hypothetical protein CO174_00585 [Candidatus Uhrbacteria bacterium CG_4_9_14_3_um_filter_50_9]|uniref:Radical SAM core domain-containing protein n=1 Tax=Candidatus Uhrbacteria bacterium CG_4_9_14_3_um_filter_50_9 TaxID=1975035 RepID=A0A2M7XE96_9BACT|nr:MAG: hypothetical protein CO174_00585 [Candidatus Uhrbacteria bacterium CG_4_9_14_3_um_filter_50_9]
MENFLIILDRRGCNKRCPYCTAKITNWPCGNDRLHLLADVLEGIQERGTLFDYLTISGNGEPAFYRPETLSFLREVIDTHRKPFRYLRIQTGGHLFFDPVKFEYFHDFIMELTRVAVDPEEDMRILGYRRDHTRTHTYKRATIGLNHVLLRANFPTLLDDLERYRDQLGDRLHNVNLKILNVNTRVDERTRTGEVFSPEARWIQQHALLAEDVDRVIEQVSGRLPLVGTYNPITDQVVWDLHGVPLVMVTKRQRYGRLHVTFNKGELIDYLLRPIPLDDLR